MLFLLNDVVLKLETAQLAPPIDGNQFAALRLDTVSALGAELFAAEPLLHQTNQERAMRLAGLITLKAPQINASQERAMRLAGLITLKAPQINAALFIAPARNCPPGQVTFRFAQLGFEVMSNLYTRQNHGGLTTLQADREVWHRLAA